MTNALPTYNAQPLGEAFTADQVVGNRVETKQPVTVYEGFPGSSRTRSWPAGKLSPLVNSFVTRNGNVWWTFGEEQPILYVKHDSNALKLVPDTGSKFLNKDDQTTNPFALGFDMEDVQEFVKKAAIFGGIGLGLYLFTPLLRAGIKIGAEKIAENEL
jgi:hypothetical protein